jgi:hypothetical protein
MKLNSSSVDDSTGAEESGKTQKAVKKNPEHDLRY